MGPSSTGALDTKVSKELVLEAWEPQKLRTKEQQDGEHNGKTTVSV